MRGALSRRVFRIRPFWGAERAAECWELTVTAVRALRYFLYHPNMGVSENMGPL